MATQTDGLTPVEGMLLGDALGQLLNLTQKTHGFTSSYDIIGEVTTAENVYSLHMRTLSGVDEATHADVVNVEEHRPGNRGEAPNDLELIEILGDALSLEPDIQILEAALSPQPMVNHKPAQTGDVATISHSKQSTPSQPQQRQLHNQWDEHLQQLDKILDDAMAGGQPTAHPHHQLPMQGNMQPHPGHQQQQISGVQTPHQSPRSAGYIKVQQRTVAVEAAQQQLGGLLPGGSSLTLPQQELAVASAAASKGIAQGDAKEQANAGAGLEASEHPAFPSTPGRVHQAAAGGAAAVAAMLPVVQSSPSPQMAQQYNASSTSERGSTPSAGLAEATVAACTTVEGSTGLGAELSMAWQQDQAAFTKKLPAASPAGLAAAEVGSTEEAPQLPQFPARLPFPTAINRQAAEDPDPKVRALVHMYSRSVDRRSELWQKQQQERIQQQLEALSKCTFSPKITERSRKIVSRSASPRPYNELSEQQQWQSAALQGDAAWMERECPSMGSPPVTGLEPPRQWPATVDGTMRCASARSSRSPAPSTPTRHRMAGSPPCTCMPEIGSQLRLPEFGERLYFNALQKQASLESKLKQQLQEERQARAFVARQTLQHGHVQPRLYQPKADAARTSPYAAEKLAACTFHPATNFRKVARASAIRSQLSGSHQDLQAFDDDLLAAYMPELSRRGQQYTSRPGDTTAAAVRSSQGAAAGLSGKQQISPYLDWDEFIGRQANFLEQREARLRSQRQVQPPKRHISPGSERMLARVSAEGPPGSARWSAARGSSPGRRPRRALDPELTFKPQISERAARRQGRSLSEMVEGGRARREEWLEAKRLEVELEQALELTFRPSYEKTAHTFPDIRPQLSMQNPDRMLSLWRTKQQVLEVRQAEARAEQQEREMQECTFRPCTTPFPDYLMGVTEPQTTKSQLRREPTFSFQQQGPHQQQQEEEEQDFYGAYSEQQQQQQQEQERPLEETLAGRMLANFAEQGWDSNGDVGSSGQPNPNTVQEALKLLEDLDMYLGQEPEWPAAAGSWAEAAGQGLNGLGTAPGRSGGDPGLVGRDAPHAAGFRGFPAYGS